MVGRTTRLIPHRLSTVRRADVVLHPSRDMLRGPMRGNGWELLDPTIVADTLSRWELAALHLEYATLAERLKEQTHLLKYDREYFGMWTERALQATAGDAPTVRQIEWLTQPSVGTHARLPENRAESG